MVFNVLIQVQSHAIDVIASSAWQSHKMDEMSLGVIASSAWQSHKMDEMSLGVIASSAWQSHKKRYIFPIRLPRSLRSFAMTSLTSVRDNLNEQNV